MEFDTWTNIVPTGDCSPEPYLFITWYSTYRAYARAVSTNRQVLRRWQLYSEYISLPIMLDFREILLPIKAHAILVRSASLG